jgi:hypothetical protein
LVSANTEKPLDDPVDDSARVVLESGGAKQQPEPLAEHLVALLVARAGRIVLVLGGAERWRRELGATLVPLELPGGRIQPGAPIAPAVSALAGRWLAVPARILPSAAWYGPSTRHAVDRHLVDRYPSAAEHPGPVVLFTRMAPDEREGSNLHPVTVRIYRATLNGAMPDGAMPDGREPDAKPGTECAGLLWLTPGALRRVVRGVPLAELLAERDIGYQPAQGQAPPDDALIYLPSEYAERYLLRVVAKYGPEAVLEASVRDPPHEPSNAKQSLKPNAEPNTKGEEIDGAGV